MFLINSCYPHFCATHIWLPKHRSSFFRSYRGNLPSSFSIVLSSALVSSTYPPVSVSGTVYDEAISWNNFTAYPIHIRIDNLRHPSHLIWSRNINLVPIDYDFRPRLRSRLNLRGLALRRNPWIFGDRVSHSVCRYSCQHFTSDISRSSRESPFNNVRNAPLPHNKLCPKLRCIV